MNTENLSIEPVTANSVNTVKAPRFNSISEIIRDPCFIDFVNKNVYELRMNRHKRPEPKPGYHYKRDWYDRMSDGVDVNARFFLKNIENIWLKKSLLSSEIRAVIQYVCDKSLQQTLLEYAKKEDRLPGINLIIKK
jgi:hypothetical protein